jgi:50S ribosomal protein L16 3-hydroxylase
LAQDELAGLACEEDIEARLIEEHGADGPWQLSLGPFTDDDFASLPEKDWTLLVQDVDKHIPKASELLKYFNFIPSWRRDDLMISYAPEGGSVGAHVDSYDVFLLQAMGQREWQIGDVPLDNPDFIEGLPIRILKQFEAAQSWVLEPGDMLYLPPHFAHHGIALTAGMTYSFGFRSPSQIDVLDEWLHTLTENELGNARYGDPDLDCPQYQYELDAKAVDRFRAQLMSLLNSPDAHLQETLGKLLTQTKPSLEVSAEMIMSEQPTDANSIIKRLAAGEKLMRNPFIRWLWIDEGESLGIYVAGERIEMNTIDVNTLKVME